ncbi:MAG: type II secretion system protein [Luteolibacter sp.]|jgi:prepilin-type N-terminal cleavage/methylation domain-containing protein|nr:type II secretion system protein [Luteolibacter sp.]
MKTHLSPRKRGFSLIETVIAIGVLAVLLTGFMIVFAPAAAGIKRSISIQEADRLASTLEQELVNWRSGNPGTTGFDKAFEWIKDSDKATTALMIYQYRASLSASLSGNRADGTPNPVPLATNNVPGKDYYVQTMVRRKGDAEFLEDLEALEGGVYLVKCTQFVYGDLPAPLSGKGLKPGTAGQIKNPKPNSSPPDPNYKAGPFTDPDEYPEAVIAFSAEFFSLPGRSEGYLDGAFVTNFAKFKTPVFTRNLAVRR